MENALLELKGKLKMLYASYGSYLLVLFKFLLAFLVFEEINRLLPYVEGLDQIFVVLLASLICSTIPCTSCVSSRTISRYSASLLNPIPSGEAKDIN